MKINQKGFIVPVLVAIIAILLIGGGLYVYKNQKVEPQQKTVVSTNVSKNDPVDISANDHYTADYSYTTDVKTGGQIPEDLIFISPTGQKSVVPNAIATKIDAVIRFKATGARDGDSLSLPILPIDPTNKNQIILTTTNFPCGVSSNCPMVRKIYAYNLSTKTLSLLATIPDTDLAGLELQPLSVFGSGIIYFGHQSGTNKICGGYWGSKDDRYRYFDLTKPELGLQKYTVSASKVQQDLANEQACEDKI